MWRLSFSNLFSLFDKEASNKLLRLLSLSLWLMVLELLMISACMMTLQMDLWVSRILLLFMYFALSLWASVEKWGCSRFISLWYWGLMIVDCSSVVMARVTFFEFSLIWRFCRSPIADRIADDWRVHRRQCFFVIGIWLGLKCLKIFQEFFLLLHVIPEHSCFSIWISFISSRCWLHGRHPVMSEGWISWLLSEEFFLVLFLSADKEYWSNSNFLFKSFSIARLVPPTILCMPVANPRVSPLIKFHLPHGKYPKR